MSHIPDRILSLMAFDFGTKRIGVAVGQRISGSSRELSPLKAKDGVPDWELLDKLVTEWRPDAFVVGLPLNMDGTSSEMSLRAAKFARKLEGRLHKPSYTHDERLSSYEAKGIVMANSNERDFGRHSVDGLAARLILESWMEAHPRQTEASGPAPQGE